MNIENKLDHMSKDKQEAMRLSHEYLMPNRVETWLSLSVPLVIGRREGYRLWDIDGHELQDFHLNGGVYNLGHRHPKLVAAMQEGLKHLDVGNHHFPSLVRGKLAQQLALNTPGNLHYTILTPSGSEANDVAIKTARQATGRTKIVAYNIAFHGGSGLSGAAGKDDNAKFFKSAFKDEMIGIPFNDLDALETALKNEDVALFIAETLPATFGFALPDKDYYKEAKKLCERYGSLFAVDEVQTGLARSGKLWAIEHFGVVPDILTTGKGLGGGLYPIGAVVMTKEVGAWLQTRGWGYTSSFGGSELGCHVALQSLELISSPATAKTVEDNANYMGSGLKNLQSQYPFLSDVRQLGVIFALGFDAKDGGRQMAQALYQEGLWAMFAGYDLRYLQFKLGLLVDRAYCDEALGKLETALKKRK